MKLRALNKMATFNDIDMRDITNDDLFVFTTLNYAINLSCLNFKDKLTASIYFYGNRN